MNENTDFLTEDEQRRLGQIEPEMPMIHRSDLPEGDQTLTVGWHLDTHMPDGVDMRSATVHVYTQGPDICLHVFRPDYDRRAVDPGARTTLEFVRAASLPAHRLRPTKRSYPERTSRSFAEAMIRAEADLSLTTYDASRADRIPAPATEAEQADWI